MRTRSSVVLVAALATVLMPLPAHGGSAGEEAYAGLTVSPPLVQLPVEPGQELTQTFSVYNEGGAPERLTVDLLDWAPGEDGASVVFPDEPTEFAMAEWMSISPKTVIVPAQHSMEFTLTVDVPKTAGPGGRYGAVNFRPVRPTVPGAVQVEQVVSALVLLEVAGDVAQGASLTEFGTRTRAVTGSRSDAEPETVLSTPAFDFFARIRNTGNVHLRPTLIVEVTNLFGGTGATVDNTGPQATKGLVLPASTRAYRVPMQGRLWPGFYRARLTAAYADGQPPLAATTSFWYLPMWFLLGVPLLLVALMVLLVYRRSRRRGAPQAQPDAQSGGRHRAAAVDSIPQPRAEAPAEQQQLPFAPATGTVLPGQADVPGPRPPGASEHGDRIGPPAPPESETGR